MPPMPETRSAAIDQPAPDELISFFEAIPNGRYRRGVRYQQWFLLLVAVLRILSGGCSFRDLEAFARRASRGPEPGAGPGVQALDVLFNITLAVQ